MHEHEHPEQRFGTAGQRAEWDERYSRADGSMWSGRPNGRLVAEVADLTPGRALDVGCGEGADAIWLAGRGWAVTAIDVSEVAVSRAREAGGLAGAAVEWVCGDVLQTPFPARSFDLVSMHYPALPKAAGDPATRGLLDTVRAGGLLLAVYHDLDDEHREHLRSEGLDPADYVGADDLVALLGDDFTVEQVIEPRIDPPPGTPHVADIVLRARRDRVRALVIDAANVIGSRPTGWWRDRPGAARAFTERVRAAVKAGRLAPPVTVVLEGRARAGAEGEDVEGVKVVHAEGEGDDTIAAIAEANRDVVVVTADRGLAERARAVDAEVVGPTWLLDRLLEAGDGRGQSGTGR